MSLFQASFYLVYWRGYDAIQRLQLAADFRQPHGKRTFTIITKNNIPLFVNPELLAIQSKDFREKYEKAIANGKTEVNYEEFNVHDMSMILESVCPTVYSTYPYPPSGCLQIANDKAEVNYEEFNVHDMSTILESVCPTVYSTYPYPPSVYDVSFLSLAARRLKMDNLLRVCERVLEEDVNASKTWPVQLLGYFDAAYRCKMQIELQARFLSMAVCNSLYGYNSDHEMFRSPTASVFLRALIQHRSGFFEHYGTHALGEINPESPGECSECTKQQGGGNRARRWRRRCRSRFLLLCIECSASLCTKCRRKPCIAKVIEFLNKSQLP
uniref:BTB domain-containing protein n=1 Tax=Ascaris lumbricoides TaxID=6252 RepID=A0A0M3IRM0_ASCLU